MISDTTHPGASPVPNQAPNQAPELDLTQCDREPVHLAGAIQPHGALLVLTEPELVNLRKYLSHGGFFFASGCCTSPGFPKAWRREFSRIFPNEKVKPIPYDPLIYRAFYKIDRIRCLHESREIQLEGIFYEGNVVAVMCEDGLCCAFSANNTCNPGKGISPEDGQKLTLNIAVYALTH